MSKNCYLCLCNSKQLKQVQEQKVTLHKFPKDAKMRKAWFQVCGLSEKVDDVSRVKICTLHFTPNDYTQPYAKLRGGRLVLKKTAVPVPGRLPSSPSVVRSSPMYVLQETKLFKVDISDDQEVPIVGLQLELDDAEDIENLRPW